MNRSEEYRALLRQLEDTPEQLNFTVARAKARARRRRRLRLVGTPLGSFAAACACFVLLVNLSTPFAMACSRVPVLRELAQAETGLLLGGRLAEYRYYDMDKVIASAFRLAEKEWGEPR